MARTWTREPMVGRRRSAPTATLLALLLGAVFFAGCADAGPSASTLAPDPGKSQDPAAETGSIRVSVLSSELQPIQGAQVVLAGTDHQALTSADGTVQFTDLLPGPHTVAAAKPGHQPRQPKGVLVTVEAGQVHEVSLQLDPELVASAENTYHTTFPFTGFLSCTVQVYPLAAQTCGRQGVVSDPNGKSNHAWKADSVLAQTLVVEVAWEPTIGATPFQLSFMSFRERSCSATSCGFNENFYTAHGSDPIYGVVREDSTRNLTKRLSPDATKFPRDLYSETLVYCPPPACYASVVVQQKYNAWVTLFYGEQAPEGWSILPK